VQAKDDRYKTLLVIVTGLLVIATITDYKGFAYAALIIGVATIFIAAAAKTVEWLWQKLAFGLGWVNSRLLLSLIFFTVLLPVAWFSRWFTKDSLNLKRNHAASIFHTRNHRYRKEDLENIW
jgi:hypothetical protein